MEALLYQWVYRWAERLTIKIWAKTKTWSARSKIELTLCRTSQPKPPVEKSHPRNSSSTSLQTFKSTMVSQMPHLTSGWSILTPLWSNQRMQVTHMALIEWGESLANHQNRLMREACLCLRWWGGRSSTILPLNQLELQRIFSTNQTFRRQSRMTFNFLSMTSLNSLQRTN